MSEVSNPVPAAEIPADTVPPKTAARESGHAKNVANLEKLIAACQSFGAKYNPFNADISIASLQSLYQSSLAAVDAVNAGVSNMAEVTNNREVVFKTLAQMHPKVLGALKASGVKSQTIDDAVTISRKLRGQRAAAKSKASLNGETFGGETIYNSVSQLSYDNREANFKKMVEVIKIQPKYNPNEQELSLAALSNFCTVLAQSNTAVKEAAVYAATMRIQRDEILYTGSKNLADTVAMLKEYVKSLYGSISQQYKLVKSIRITRQAR